MLSSIPVAHENRSVEPNTRLDDGQNYSQHSQSNGTQAVVEYTLTIFAPNDLYVPATLKCKTRTEFLEWLHITRRCGYFHQVSTN